jgi:hypothetical protein
MTYEMFLRASSKILKCDTTRASQKATHRTTHQKAHPKKNSTQPIHAHPTFALAGMETTSYLRTKIAKIR